ncbi:DUF192 domain-containing protein [Candidatus Woesearchaeota archaeon]|nr:DUF192 domain-containing protein [Candidatus Woesearchaeota archaeon]
MITNTTKKTVIALQEKTCATFWSQLLGMIGKKDPCTLLFVFSSSRIVRLHMWFVRFPIDIILIDTNSQVVEIQQHLLPWRFWSSTVLGSSCIECPAGTITASRTQVGDVVHASSFR